MSKHFRMTLATFALAVSPLEMGRIAAQRPAASPSSVRRGGTARLDAMSAEFVRTLGASGRLTLPEIRFGGASDTLLAASESVVAAVARALLSVDGDYLVEAHAARSGNTGADLARTDRRAATVRARLLRYGIPASRLLAMGYGATKPPAPLPNGQPASPERIEVSRIP